MRYAMYDVLFGICDIDASASLRQDFQTLRYSDTVIFFGLAEVWAKISTFMQTPVK